MRYLYSARFLKRDLFDAAKARLRQPSPATPSMPFYWLDGTHYGWSIVLPGRTVKFLSKRGTQLPVASAPLCTSDPEAICRLQERPGAMPPPPDPQPGEADLAAAAAAQAAAANAGAAMPPAAGHPPSGGGMHGGMAARQPSQQEDESLRPPPSRISTAALSTVLGLSVAITVGIIVGNNAPFRPKLAMDRNGGELLATAGASAESILPTSRSIQPGTAPAASTPPAGASDTQAGLAAPGPSPDATEKATIPVSPRPQIRSKKAPSSSRSTVTAKKSRNTDLSSGNVKTPRALASSGVTASRAGAAQSKSGEIWLGTQYASCDKIRGLLRQERCRWEVCNGKWGKYGCPAYHYKTSPELQFGQSYRLPARPATGGG